VELPKNNSLKKSLITYILSAMLVFFILTTFAHEDHQHLYFLILLTLVLASILIYRRISTYQKEVQRIYKQQLEKINKSETYLKALFDINPNIVITTDGENLHQANPTMLNFFGFNTIEEFKNKYDCICDNFIKKIDCLPPKVGELTWLEHVIKEQNTTHKACMLKDEKEHIFMVWAKPVAISGENLFIVMFTDITELENVKNRLE